MSNLLTKATLGIALGAATLTAAVPAEAQRYRNDRYHHRDRGGEAIVAGIAGLAIGAALTSGNRGYDRYDDRRYYRQRDYYPNRGYYPSRGYNRGYYNGGYNNGYHGGGYDRCQVRRVYDPYLGRRVRVRYC